jgi:hypothetical protein
LARHNQFLPSLYDIVEELSSEIAHHVNCSPPDAVWRFEWRQDLMSAFHEAGFEHAPTFLDPKQAYNAEMYIAVGDALGLDITIEPWIRAAIELAHLTANTYIALYEDHFQLCERPTKINLLEGAIHNPTAAACKWDDEWECFALEGGLVSSRVILEPSLVTRYDLSHYWGAPVTIIARHIGHERMDTLLSDAIGKGRQVLATNQYARLFSGTGGWQPIVRIEADGRVDFISQSRLIGDDYQKQLDEIVNRLFKWGSSELGIPKRPHLMHAKEVDD